MILTRFAAAAFDTNCYVIAPAAGEECVIVDPGVGVAEVVEQVVSHYRLKPAHVLITHAHSDHVHSVTPICGAHGIAASVHGQDRYRMKDPLDDLEPELLAMLEQNFGSRAAWREPDDLRTISGGESLRLAGLDIAVSHAPGHTEGSVMFELSGVPEEDDDAEGLSRTVFTGDVLIAGSVGRTDLPGGDADAMKATLRDKVLTLPDDTYVLPGHGLTTNIGHERDSNPFLRSLAGDA